MRKTLRRAWLAAALALLCVAPAAMADSIAYVKGGNVWLSTGDGSRHFQVTSTGAYADVSQADDGTLIALTGVRLHKLDRLGNVLADFDTPVSDTRPPGSRVFWGPFDPAISPDGSKVAYTYYYMTQSQAPGCYPPQCVTAINEAGTGYSRSDRQTAWDEAGFRKHSGWRNPFWADNDTTVLSDPTHLPNYDVVVDRPGERGEGGFMAKNWFSDTAEGNPHTGAGDISRDKSKLAFQTGENDSTLTLYRVSTFPTTFPDGEAPASTRPQPCYRYSNPVGGRFGTPTFSPDGSRVAFEVGDGIHVVHVPAFTGGCTTAGASPTTKLLIPGAIQPDWGPADVPTSRPDTGGGSGGGSGGGGQSGGGSGGGSGAAIAVSRTTLKRALARGLAVRITGATPGAASLRVTYRGRLVAKARGTVAGDGTLSVRARFTRGAKRSLRRLGKARLVVTGAGARATVVLRRR